MRPSVLLAAAAACAVQVPLAAAGPLDPLKAKLKPGAYNVTIQVEVPGEKPQSDVMKSCLDQRAMDKGVLFGDAETGSHCDVKGFAMSGESASYSVICRGSPVFATDYKVTVTGAGFDAVSTTKSDGKPIMSSKAQAKYAGPCK